MIEPTLPWLTSAGECAPVAASANSKRDVLGADVAAVDPVGGAGAALDPPGDFAFARRRPVVLASRSSRIETSAKSRGGRVAVPAKITSSIPPPRSDLGLPSPITQRIASSRFDLPQPLGPTIPVRPGSILQLSRLDEALETAELQSPDAQLTPSAEPA